MGAEVILVAVDASKEISNDYALEWAVQNVTKADDSLILLPVLPSCGRFRPNLNRRRQSLAYYFLCCGTRHKEGSSFDQVDQSKRDISRQINNDFVHKMQQLWLANKMMQVNYKVEVILDAHLGSVATKAKELKASWVILDRLLKKEADHCIKQLNCNVVVIDHAIPRILKAVNPLAGENFSESRSQSKQTERGMLGVIPNILDYKSETTPSTSDIKSSTFGTYSFSSPSTDKDYQCKTNPCSINDSHAFLHLNSDYFNEDFKYLETFSPSPSDIKSKRLRTKSSERKHHFERTDKARTLARRDSMISSHKHGSEPSPSSAKADRNSIITQSMSLSITDPPNLSSLCSNCKHKKNIFINAPRKFTYREIENATDGFSDCNFMAKGEYGCVYRGELPDGQVITVKQYKKLKAFAASEFSSEVETLSSAHHRNLLMLVGYCIDTEWFLIFEFACNGSLDKHLYGAETNQVMAWHDRMKVAVGTARGLRYLHEDCRVGCILHRDLRPSNILLTHDFEPMIGDFGLARWQPNAQSAEETHLIGTFGYLAPECIQTGQVSEKADVYAFGVILLELLSGFRAIEFSRKTGKQSLSEWGSTMIEKKKTNELIDSRLNNNYVEKGMECMMHAAYLCTSPLPEQRPRMSQVLNILEGDSPIDGAYFYQSSKIFNNGLVGSIKPKKDNLKLSQNNKTNFHVNSDIDSASNPLRCSSQVEVSESVTSLDYVSYLRGSLAKFVQNSK